MGFIPFLALALGVAALSYFAWISTQSLLQARMLFRLARRPGEAPDERGRQAFYGRVAVTRAVRKMFGDVLWCRTQHQVYRRRRKSSGWRTESTQEELAEFAVEAHAGPVRLADLPTEVQGAQAKTVVVQRTGWFGLAAGHGDRRTVYTYLPILPYAAVVGRHKDRDAVERDNKLGLLLTPREPSQAAWIELGKGVAGLLAITAVLAFALAYYYGRRP
jgi:hypothetical protein